MGSALLLKSRPLSLPNAIFSWLGYEEVTFGVEFGLCEGAVIGEYSGTSSYLDT